MLGFAAYAIWGLLPAYVKLLDHVSVLELVAHRVVWALLLILALAVGTRRWQRIVAIARQPRLLAMLGLSTLFIAANWLAYVWGVMNNHVIETSLGYYINPLVNVALAMLVLKERMRPLQGVAVALAACGVLALAIDGGAAPWLSLGLAFSFAFYGLIRKLLPVDAIEGLAIETALLAPFALGWLVWLSVREQASFGADTGTDLLLMLGGLITAVPLLLFAAAAKKIRYTTLGLIQYVAPTLQFLQAVLVFGEPLRPIHYATFGCIWLGLAIYATDSFRSSRLTPMVPE